MRIYLLRHGESTGNATGIIQGRGEYPLTERGRGQAIIAGKFLALQPDRITHIYASPMVRALQTAELIREQQPDPRPMRSTHEALQEIDAGKIAGLTFDEVRATHPEFFGRPLANWLDYDPWGGQRRADLFVTVHAFLDTVVPDWDLAGPNAVAIVSHAGPLRALIAYFFDQREFHHLNYHFDNCAVVRVTTRQADQGIRRTIDAFLPVEVMACCVNGLPPPLP